MNVFRFFLLLFFINTILNAQNIEIHELNSLNGLSDDNVLAIAQDKFGFIWIGTYNGLNRFDGKSVVSFQYEDDNPYSIPNSFVQTLFCDSEGLIWIGTTGGGLCKYLYEDQQFERYQTDVNNPESLPNNSVLQIAENSKGELIIATLDGISVLDKNSKKFKKIEIAPEFKLLESVISCLHVDSDDNIWLGSRSGGLLKISSDMKNMCAFNAQDSLHTLSGNLVRAIAEDSNKFIWVANYSGTLDKINIVNDSIVSISDVWYEKNKFALENIQYIAIDKSNNVWLSGALGKVYKTSAKDFEIPIDYFKKNFREISENRVFFCDTDDNIWIGTLGKGLYYFNPDEKKIEVVNSERFPLLKNNTITVVLEDSSNVFYIGTNGGGLYSYNRNIEKLVSVDIPATNILFVTDLKKDQNNTVWIATWGSGLVGYNPIDNKRFVLESSDSSILKSNNIKALYFDSETSILWIASHGYGLQFFDTQKRQFCTDSVSKNYYLPLKGIKWVHEIYKDKTGIIWVLSSTGLYAFHNGTLKTYLKDDKQQLFKSLYFINAFELDSGALYFATRKEIMKYDYGKNELIKISDTVKNYSEISNFLIDQNNNIWVTSKDKLINCGIENTRRIVFDIHDGLQGKNFFEGAASVSSKGEFFLGGFNGLNIFSSDSINRSSAFPKVYITSLKLMFSEQLPDKYKSVLNKNIMFTDRIKIPYSKNIFSLNYTAVNYLHSEKIRFQYRLIGFNEQWVDAGIDREVTYTNLNYGNYIFQLRSTNANGVWNSELVQLHIDILPPWFHTFWFKLILFLSVSFISLSIIAYRMYKVRAERRRLDAMVKERTQELLVANNALEMKQKKEVEFSNEIMKLTERVLDQNQVLEDQKAELLELNNTKNKFFSIIAHDLKNPLNGLMGFSELLHKNFNDFDDEQKQKYIEIMYSSSQQLYDLLVNLLNWSRTQSRSISYKMIEVKVNHLVDSNKQFVNSSLKKKEIEIIVDYEPDLVVFVDLNMMNTILRNIISNAIKFTPRNGKIIFKAFKNGKYITFCISDTGIGMTKEKIDSLFKIDKYDSQTGTDNEKGTGLGLIICAEFVKIHNGKIRVESEKGKGSTFFIDIPVNNF